MFFKWIDDRCIVCAQSTAQREIRCLETSIFTEEHLIPQAVGGKLSCNFLCKDCNSTLGEFEARLKEDARVRMAIEYLKDSLPGLWASMIEGQRYVTKSANGFFSAKVRSGQISLDTSKQPDGSLVCPTDQAPKIIRTKLERDGRTQIEITEALARLEALPVNSRRPITSGFEVLKFAPTESFPKLNSIGVEPCALVKIAYEYLTLNFGRTIFQEYFDPVRRMLRDGKGLPPCCLVSEMRTEDRRYKTMHGIAGKVTDSGLTIRILLFGYLSYNVQFSGITTNTDFNCYELDLKNGIETWEPIKQKPPA